MKIIDNKKDFYDYLAGINGIDEYVTYDRRNSVVARKSLDGYLKPFNSLHNEPSRDYYVYLQAGEDYKKRFLVRREVTKDNIKFTVEEYDVDGELKSQKKKSWMPWWVSDPYYGVDKELVSSQAPLVLAYRETGSRWDSWHYVKNPILVGLPLVGFLSAQDIWQAIYDYLLKMKEPEIVDTRTDEEKAESHGFDRKTSFRKDKENDKRRKS